jgi:OOP family OmpA-OmpF porin
MLKRKLIPALSIATLTLSSLAVAAPAEKTVLTKKTDTLFVILDSSSSKNATFDGDSSESTVFDTEKQLLQRINKNIPSKLKLSSGIRTFGFGSCVNWSNTQLVKEISPHSATDFQSGIDKASCAGGGSPLESALKSSATDLSNSTGNIALLVVSDAYKVSNKTLAEAAALEKQFGNRLCIYSVWVGNKNEQPGKFILQELSNISGCGQSVDISTVTSNKATASFVEAMLYNKTTVKVKAKTLDDDNDGVINSADKCPTTPKKAQVNEKGCWAYGGVIFNHGKSSIKKGYEALFSNATEMLKANPALIVEIQGHSDSTGPAKFNKFLSELRAKAIKAVLAKNGIESSRLTTKGFGESAPIATNDTAAGREINRRVELKASYK